MLKQVVLAYGEAPGLKGSLVLTTSVNAAVARHGSVAYDTSKAAAQAEIAYLLSSTKFSKTTGQIISVDGGLHEVFLR
jgi:NAD(P)-dependent dehydrogenase (short-subunit alcohol dehydrogenase family)